MSVDTPLFKTPSLESHLLNSTAIEVDRALESLNEDGAFPTAADALTELLASLVARYGIRQVPQIDEEALRFSNDRNQVLTIEVPIRGNIYFLTYQVRGMPSPTFVGQIHMEGEAGLILIGYKLKPVGPRGWEASLDGDMAMLRTYVGAVAAAITAFNGMLPGLIEGKMKELIMANQLRRDIAEKLRTRGFSERSSEEPPLPLPPSAPPLPEVPPAPDAPPPPG